MPNEWLRTVWFAGCLAWGWVLMLLTHEIGHFIAAEMTGGEVMATNLLPWVLPYTLVEPNPSPQVVAWGGMLSGTLIPLVAWLATRAARPNWSLFPWGLLGGCWLANGCYLAVAGGESLTDTGVLLSLGWPSVLLVTIGIVIAIPGYLIARQACRTWNAQWRAGDIRWRHAMGLWIGWLLWCGVQAAVVIACGAIG